MMNLMAAKTEIIKLYLSVTPHSRWLCSPALLCPASRVPNLPLLWASPCADPGT